MESRSLNSCGKEGTFGGRGEVYGEPDSSAGRIVFVELADVEELDVIVDEPVSLVVEFCGFFARQS